MKLFEISLDNVGYDTYDGCVIIAESYEQVEQMCKKNKFCNEYTDDDEYNVFSISDTQHYTIKEIKLDEYTKPFVLLSSFNAG